MNRIYRVSHQWVLIVDDWLARLQPAFALAVRVYLARAFFFAGVVQLTQYRYTLALFRYEYEIPSLMTPHAALIITLLIELVCSIFILVGLGTRIAACILFVFNLIAANSYPDMSYVAYSGHMLWGVLLAYLMVYGGGVWSIDGWLRRRHPE